jgi:hypothetical protein
MLKNALVIAVLALGGVTAFTSCTSKNNDCAPGASHCPCKGAVPFCDGKLTCMDNICINTGTANMMMTGGMGGNDTGSGGRATGGRGGSAGNVGSTGGKGGSGAPEVCMSTPDATTCRKCIDSGCCNEFNGCLRDNLDCRRLINCLANCNDGDTVCQDNCVAVSSQTGVDLLVGLFTCIDNKCTTEKGGSNACDPEPPGDGGMGGSGPPVGDGGMAMCTDPINATPCRLCLDQKCCSQVNACVSRTSPCAMFGDCVVNCMDAACEQMCATKFPAGVQPLDNLDMCGNANCAQVCM